MEKYVIRGGRRIDGVVRVCGSKNATLPVMTAALMAPGRTILHGAPRINDVRMMAHVLRIVGAHVEHEDGDLTIDAERCNFFEVPYELVSQMRASIYVLGPLLARFGKAIVSFPGGCALGARPIDLHLMAMEQLGAKLRVEHGYIYAETDGLRGGLIDFPKSSVGATANALMAASMADGDTIIRNAAIEPDIGSLIDFLNLSGANIEGRDTTEITVHGVKELHPVETRVIPDRIETGTLMIAAAITGSTLTIEECQPEHNPAEIEMLRRIGCRVETGPGRITVIPVEKLNPVDIVTLPFPGFPTDLQPQFMTLLSLVEGVSHIEETIYPERYNHVAELNRLNADIRLEGAKATIKGVSHLSGAEVMASDLRAGIALVLAGLAAQGETVVSRIYHIDRGYDHFESKLQALGADIRRVIG
jgi:UDP-N-acetylglucosamine 1-carboxyvinyltransferase